MVDFRKHSLKNYTYDDVKGWLSDGIENVARIMDVDKDELGEVISDYEHEIRERALHPTIKDSSEERRELRRGILADYINLYQDAGHDRRAIIVLGQIASGKSSFCKKLESGGDCAVVDVDFIKQGHGFMEGLKQDFDEGKGTDMVHEEASMLAKEYLNMMSNFGYNLVIPKSGTDYNSIEHIVELLKYKGYEVTLCYIDLPIKKCVERNFYRFIDEYRRGLQPRLIPFNVIKTIDDKPFKTFARFLSENSPYVDRYAAYSNDVEQGEEMIPIDINEILDYIEHQEERSEGD